MVAGDHDGAVAEIGRARDRDPFDALSDLLLEEGGIADTLLEAGHELRPMRTVELTQEEKLVRLNENFPVALARKILAKIPSEKRNTARRDELFEAAGKALSEARGKEQEKLGKSLAKLGVDWSDGNISLDGLEVALAPDLHLDAGETGQMTVTVKNNGDKAVHRVWGRSDSDNPFLKNIDFSFGLLPDFRTGQMIVGIDISLVKILPDIERIRRFAL